MMRAVSMCAVSMRAVSMPAVSMPAVSMRAVLMRAVSMGGASMRAVSMRAVSMRAVSLGAIVALVSCSACFTGTLDHVASTSAGAILGGCTTLGEAPDTQRLDGAEGGNGCDHRALLCDLNVPLGAAR